MACPRYDLHVHTKYLGCANETMELPTILAECERLGVKVLGITDHLNAPGKLDLHRPIREDILALDTGMPIYFGVELNFMSCDGEFAFNADIKAELGFQFAIGGIHATYVEEYDLQKIIDNQHRHHLKTCQDPLVDVLVHPYWFGRGDFERGNWPWFDSMKPVPESYARELGQVARETGTAIEINGGANLVNQEGNYAAEYVDYLAIIAEEGPMFSIGSDAHDVSHLARIEPTWAAAEQIGLTEDRIWRPSGTPLGGQE